MTTLPHLSLSEGKALVGAPLAVEELLLLQTPFGEERIDDPLVLALLRHPAMERLRDIEQSGPSRYLWDYPPFSRWDHSIGVYALLRRYRASREEQVAGLLHDASHTVFSHVGDYLFGEGHPCAYQDGIHAWYLERQGVVPLLERYGMTLEKALPGGGSYGRLEQELPDLCADRIEYTLHTAHLWGNLEDSEIAVILSHLFYEEGRWFFDEAVIAERFARLSLTYTLLLWSSPRDMVSYHFIAKAIGRAMELELLTFEELHFGCDTPVLEKLHRSHDEAIAACLAVSADPLRYGAFVDPSKGDLHLMGKVRAVDPWVKSERGIARLSSLSPTFAHDLATTTALVQAGVHYRRTAQST